MPWTASWESMYDETESTRAFGGGFGLRVGLRGLELDLFIVLGGSRSYFAVCVDAEGRHCGLGFPKELLMISLPFDLLVLCRCTGVGVSDVRDSDPSKSNTTFDARGVGDASRILTLLSRPS